MKQPMKQGSSQQWGKDTAVFPELTPTVRRQLAERIYQLMRTDLRRERERLPTRRSIRR